MSITTMRNELRKLEMQIANRQAAEDRLAEEVQKALAAGKKPDDLCEQLFAMALDTHRLELRRALCGLRAA